MRLLRAILWFQAYREVRGMPSWVRDKELVRRFHELLEENGVPLE